MPQLHLYVPDDVASEVARRAESEGVSVSRFLANLVRRDVATGWPDGYFETVVGAWKGEPLERAPQLEVEERKPF